MNSSNNHLSEGSGVDTSNGINRFIHSLFFRSVGMTLLVIAPFGAARAILSQNIKSTATASSQSPSPTPASGSSSAQANDNQSDKKADSTERSTIVESTNQDGRSNLKVTVNGSPIPVPSQGSYQKTITNDSGNTHISVQNNQSATNSSQTNTNVGVSVSSSSSSLNISSSHSSGGGQP